MTKPSNEDHDSDTLNIVVVVVGGLPGAGKSSLVQKLRAALSGSNSSHEQNVFDYVHIIEYDDVQQSLLDSSGEYTSLTSDDPFLEAWRKSRSVALERFGKLLENKIASNHPQLPTKSKTRNILIILDDNFHLRSMRKQVYQVCQSAIKSAMENIKDNSSHLSSTLYFGSIWLDTPIETCLLRNSTRPRDTRVSNNTIQRIHDSCEPPEEGRATWETNFLVLDGSDHTEIMSTNLSLLSDFLSKIVVEGTSESVRPPISLKDEEERLERERVTTIANRSHQLDQTSRSWIKAVAKLRPQSAKLANQVRKEMLKTKQSLIQSEDDLGKIFVKRLLEASQDNWSSSDKDELLLQVSMTMNQ